jgi:hypothetical protein
MLAEGGHRTGFHATSLRAGKRAVSGSFVERQRNVHQRRHRLQFDLGCEWNCTGAPIRPGGRGTFDAEKTPGELTAIRLAEGRPADPRTSVTLWAFRVSAISSACPVA